MIEKYASDLYNLDKKEQESWDWQLKRIPQVTKAQPYLGTYKKAELETISMKEIEQRRRISEKILLWQFP